MTFTNEQLIALGFLGAGIVVVLLLLIGAVKLLKNDDKGAEKKAGSDQPAWSGEESPALIGMEDSENAAPPVEIEKPVGAFWRFLLWLVALPAWANLIPGLPTAEYGRYLLLAALGITGLGALIEVIRAKKRWQLAVEAGILVVFALGVVGAIWLPETPALSQTSLWVVPLQGIFDGGLIVLAIVALQVGAGRWPSRGLRITLIGLLAGLGAGRLLLMGLPGLAAGWLAPEIQGALPPAEAVGVVVWVTAAALLVLAGPAAVAWTRPSSVINRLGNGALAGGLAGAALAACLGAPLAAALGMGQVYGSSLENDQTIRLLGAALNMMPLYSAAAFGGLSLAGAVLGGLTGLATIVTQGLERRSTLFETAVSAVLSLPVYYLIFLVVFALLNPAVMKVLDLFGDTPVWDPNWNALLQLAVPLGFLLVMLGLGLAGLEALPAGSHARKMGGLMYGLFGLASIGLGGYYNSLPLVAAGIVMAAAGARSGALEGVWRPGGEDNSPDIYFDTAGLLGSLLSFLAVSSVGTPLIVIFMTLKGADPSASAKASLLSDLSTVYGLNSLTLLVVLVSGVLVGGFGLGWVFSWGWLARLWGALCSSRSSGWLRRGLLAGLALTLLAGSLFIALPDKMVAQAAIALSAAAWIWPSQRGRWRLGWLLAAFAAAAGGLALLGLKAWEALPGELGVWGQPVVITLASIGLVAGMRAFLDGMPLERRTLPAYAAAVFIIIGLGLAWLPGDLARDFRAAVLSFNGSSWQRLEAGTLTPGERYAAGYFSGQDGKFWLVGGAGLMMRQEQGAWVLRNPGFGAISAPESERLRLLRQAPKLIQQGNYYWMLGKGKLVRFEPGGKESGIEPKMGENKVQISAELRDLALGPQGEMYLATRSDGVLRLKPGEPLEASQWDYLNLSSGLPDNFVYKVFVDKSGTLWAGVVSGLYSLANDKFEAVKVPGYEKPSDVYTFLEDRQKRLWVGVSSGGLVRDATGWHTFLEMPGWPGELTVSALLEDKQGQIWAGTESGALKYDGQRWDKVVDGMPVDHLAASPDGTLWFGGREGLVRLAGGSQQRYNAENGLVYPQVSQLAVDPQGKAWVTTVQDLPVSNTLVWAGLGLGWLVLAGLLAWSLRSYRPTDEYTPSKIDWDDQAEEEGPAEEEDDALDDLRSVY
jgi:hypothetical protein